MTVDRIISDGQPGAARGALDAALDLALSHGGGCPWDRRADDGPLPPRYLLHAVNGGFAERCAFNVKHSDGTLIVALCTDEDLDGRAAYTRTFARNKRQASGFVRVFADVEPSESVISSTRAWLDRYCIRTLHVSGPLERMQPGLATATTHLLMAVLGKARR